MPGRKKRKHKDLAAKTNLEVLPVRFFDEKTGSFLLEDGSYMDLLNMIPSDRENLQGDELQYNMIVSTRFYRLYGPDVKFISMNFPINTSVQRVKLQKKLQKTADAVRRVWILREIEELEKLESHIMRREFYLMYFGREKDEFLKNKNRILKTIGFGRNKLVEDMSKEKKIQILRKICNMNALILPDELKEESNEEE